MSVTPPAPSTPVLFSGLIEPLESRIAPAGFTLLLGPSAQGGVGYSDAHFVKTSANPVTDPISAEVGVGNPLAPTYYLKLPSGSQALVLPSEGSIHSAGQKPWPTGIFALNSTRPYWKSNLLVAWPVV